MIVRVFRSGVVLSASTIAFAGLLWPATAFAQDEGPPSLRAGAGAASIHIDGILNEPAWRDADQTDAFAQADPREGEPPTLRTVVQVVTDRDALVIGIVCEDPVPSGVVSFSVRRDANLDAEDHVAVVVGPFMDGRSGYVFSVNPTGARYDGLINPGREGANSDWDGVWEAATARNASGWTVEIRIPIRTINFRPGLREWHFNVERRVQRLLEVDRWAFPTRQNEVTQTTRAGLLTNLPEFALGLGLMVRPALTTGGGRPAPGASLDGDFQPSVDITQRIGGNVVASFTANTDFAETEVDTRRTNLTRFPLFFPEKRTFFLEGTDLFQFGPLPNEDTLAFHSRRIGLVGGHEVPLVAGGKVNGRIGNTSFGGLVVRTNDQPGVVSTGATMGVARVKQNLGEQSSVGMIATVGDPLGRSNSWLTGADFTYGTSRLRGDKNFFASAWAMMTGRDDLGSDSTAHGVKIDYPNDHWDFNFFYKRVGLDFDPSLGFVQRSGVRLWGLGFANRNRLPRGRTQEIDWSVRPSLATDLAGGVESYSSTVRVNWKLRSGDSINVNVTPAGERLVEPFRISSGLSVAPGSYDWLRRNIGFSTAQKRRFYATVAWEFGDFYDGDLTQYTGSGTWNPTPLFTVDFNTERNIGDLRAGRFTQTLVGTRVRVNFSPDLSVSSYTQYETDSDSVGINTRLRWTFVPVGDLFVVYNHNLHQLLDRWELESNQFLVKLQYAWLR
jgi:Domain of unknown function (DUF5916)